MGKFTDRYEVLSELGRGASAETTLARDKTDGTLVCVKRLHAERVDEWQQVDAFRREVKVLKSLEHPAIPASIAAFEEEGADGRPDFVLVQQYIEGRSLRDRIDQGPRPDETEIIGIIDQVLQVLSYLHTRTPPVFHRDVKPSNILLSADGQVTLVDFGAVCDGWRLAGEGTVVGTVGYMAPEQHLGQTGPRSDLYSVGATVLNALTGQPPSDFDVSSGAPTLPPDLAPTPLGRFVTATMTLAPASRPATAEDCRRLLSGEAQHVVTTASSAVPSDPRVTRLTSGLSKALAHLEPAALTRKLAETAPRWSPLPTALAFLVAMTSLLLGVTALTRGRGTSGLLITAFLGLVGAGAIALGTGRAMRRRLLAAPVSTGRIVESEVHAQGVTVRYAYVAGGEKRVGSALLGLEFSETHLKGTDVTVVVDPAKPDRSHMLALDADGEIVFLDTAPARS